MSIKTFGYQQELKSKEFGALAYLTIKKGVYTAPTITVSNGTITISLGSYVFYDTDNQYAVRYIQGISDDISESTSGHTTDYVYLRFAYSASTNITPTIEFDSEILNDDNYVRICKLNSSDDGYDESVMELCGDGLSCPHRVLEFYGEEEHYCQVSDVTTMEGTGSIAGSITRASDEYLYVDETGALKTAKNNVPRFGKLVLVDVDDQNIAKPIRFPVHGEINSNSIEVKALTSYDNANQATIYTSSKDSSKGDTIALSSLLKQATKIIGELQSKVAVLETQVTALETWKTAMTNVAEINAQNPNTLSIKSGKTLSINGTIDFGSNSSFGSSTSPINTLYVKDTLYTDTLSINQQ